MKKLFEKIIGGVIVIMLLFQFNGIVLADEIKDLQNKQSDNSEKIDEAKQQKQQVSQEKNETQKQVDNLNNQISDYESQIGDLDLKITNLNTQIEDSQNKITQKQEDYKKEKELLEKRLVATYEAGETSYLDVLLSSKSLTDLISNYYLVTELTRNDKELMEKIKKEEEEIAKAKTTLENSKSELNNSKVAKQSKATQLKQTKSQKDSYVSKLSEDEKNTQEQLEQFERDKRDIQAQLAAIAKKEAEAAASAGNSNNNIVNNPSASGYIRPIVGYGITCGWMGYANHTGIDFSGAGISGKPILAAKSGTVVTSTALKNSNGTYRSYGEYIVINHHDGTMTLYAHGAPGSRLVSVGQKVSQGQQIMSVGTTGNSTGYHLHFEVRVNGVPVNPAPYLK